jgi:PBP1b-binding outer membrane lipoprotein LpoB
MRKLSFLIPVLALTFLISSCNNYGKKVKKEHIETYYKDGITEAEAQKTADMMFALDVNNAKTEKSFQLVKENNTIHLRMVVIKDKIDKSMDINFLAISNIVSDSVFNGAPVDMDLTNNKFEVIRTLPYRKVTDEDFKKEN